MKSNIYGERYSFIEYYEALDAQSIQKRES